MSKPDKFTIDRSKWARGRGGERSQLMNIETRHMCCLGFAALAFGVAEKQIEGCGDYNDVSDSRIPVELAGGRNRQSTELHDEICRTNDSPFLADTAREQRITELFATIGVAVEFVDGDGGGV